MPKVKEKQLVKCYDCDCAYLMQKGSDPVVSLCLRDKETRQVASTIHPCIYYTELQEERTINELIKAR